MNDKIRLLPARRHDPQQAPLPKPTLAEIAAQYAEARARYEAATAAEASWRDARYLAWLDCQRLLDQLKR